MARIRQHGISSKEDFELLWQKRIYPMNRLSAAAKEEFKNALVFDGATFHGWVSAPMITHEFNFEEFYKFHQLLLASDGVFIIDNPEDFPYSISYALNVARLYNPSWYNRPNIWKEFWGKKWIGNEDCADSCKDCSCNVRI